MIIDFAHHQDGRRRDEGAVLTGNPIQTSASPIFRIRDDQFVEHWQVLDTYRILVAIGAIPRTANAFQQILGVDSEWPNSPESTLSGLPPGGDPVFV